MSAEELALLTPDQKTRLARQLGLPEAVLEHIVPSRQQTLHYQNRCPAAHSTPKGPHPQMYALLRDCADSSISSTESSQLRTKHVADQLRAICKHRVYEQFAAAIEEIWANLQPVVDEWRHEAGTALGTLREISSNAAQTTMMLVPLEKKELEGLAASPSLEALFVQLMHYTRNTWGAMIMQWSQKSGPGHHDEHLPRYLTQTARPVPFIEDLLRGVNTAIKINYGINYLLLKHADKIESQKTWQQMQEYNYSFAALWAAGSITTLAALTEKLVFHPDRETVDYLTRIGMIEPSSYAAGQPGYELLDPTYFSVRGDAAGKQTIDLAESKMAEIRRAAVQADVIVKKCPALKIGVVKSMYTWISEIVTETIKRAGYAPWDPSAGSR